MKLPSLPSGHLGNARCSLRPLLYIESKYSNRIALVRIRQQQEQSSITHRKMLTWHLYPAELFIWLYICALLGFQVYACATCQTHLSTEGNVMSKEFTTQNGRGFLVNSMINVTNGPSDDRNLRTGTHTCRDVYCVTCDTAVGWEYLGALEREHKYKVGNFVLDLTRTMRYHWESVE